MANVQNLSGRHVIAAALVPGGIIVLGLISRYVFPIPNQPGVLLALVAFSGLMGGLWTGVFAAIVQILFTLWFVNGVEVGRGVAPFIQWGDGALAISLSAEEFQRFAVFLVVTSAVALATGRMHWKHAHLTHRQEELESFSQSMFHKAAVGIVYADMKGTIIRCNRVFEAIVGRTARQLEGQRFDTLIYPEDAASNIEATKDLFAGKVDSVTIVNRYVRPSGQPVWVRKIANLLHDATGKPKYIMVFAREIGADMAKDAKIAAAELRYRTLWEHSPQANLTLFTPSMTIEDANGAAVTLFEAGSKADLQSYSLFALSSDRQIDADSSGRTLQGHLQELWDKGSVRFDWLFRTSSGREICCVVSMARFSSEGRQGAQVMLRDITDSVALEKLQKEQNAIIASELHRSCRRALPRSRTFSTN